MKTRIGSSSCSKPRDVTNMSQSFTVLYRKRKGVGGVGNLQYPVFMYAGHTYDRFDALVITEP